MSELKFSKRKQTASRGNKRKLRISEIRKKEGYCDAPESAIQKQCDDLLKIYRERYGMESMRMPDCVWRYLKQHAPAYIVKEASEWMAGFADHNVFMRLTDKYSLALHLELKSKTGRLHGKQKNKSDKIPYQISRSPEKTVEILNKMIKDIEIYRIKLMYALHEKQDWEWK